jgi:hypothetical protein
MKFLDRIFNFISPFSVAHITQRMERDLVRLRTVADNRRAAADAHMEAAGDLMNAAAEHANEAARAERVAGRLAAIVE